MRLEHIKMTRALNELDEIVGIQKVKNGKGCNCHCIVCNSPLIARQGKKRSWHFAHDTSQGEIDCAWSGETELHLRVKEYLLLPLEKIRLYLPQDHGRLNWALSPVNTVEDNFLKR